MSTQLLDTYLKGQILSVITANVPFSVFEVGKAYQRLGSFDKLLAAIDIATKEQRGLMVVVDILISLHVDIT